MRRSWLLAGTILGMAVVPHGAWAATNAQIVNAIDSGLSYLASTQQADGSWSYGGYDQAATGAVIGAFMSQKSLWGSNAAAYQTIVNNGMNYLLGSASTSVLPTNRGDGNNPCVGSAGCTGVYWYGNGEATYTTGIVASAIGQVGAANPNAIATTSGPLAGMSYEEIGQGIINEYASGQATTSNQQWSGAAGGWRYFPGQSSGTGDADGSTTQWAVISMIYGQSLGATVPQYVKTGLTQWLAFDQAPNGSACYQGPGSGLCEMSDTGSLLIGLALEGRGKTDPQAVAALNFLNSNWQSTANSTWYGNFGQPYAMWADYKALELQLGLTDNSTITNLGSCGTLDAGVTCNWWENYNEWLVDNQNGNGSWNGYGYWTDPLSTAWDVSILGGTVIPPPTTVPEPATWVMMLAGLAGLGFVGRRAHKERLAGAL
ncbi:MAG TPA: PEP-CTERM sorting domain-containing protein [Roseiarcus sp.]|nr:PEP-CTERM sorting domain-containing protein [Roseiarcus sp.]